MRGRLGCRPSHSGEVPSRGVAITYSGRTGWLLPSIDFSQWSVSAPTFSGGGGAPALRYDGAQCGNELFHRRFRNGSSLWMQEVDWRNGIRGDRLADAF